MSGHKSGATTTTCWCGCPLWAAALGMGQLLALLLAGTGVCSQALSDAGVVVPTAQSFLLYVLLALVYLPALLLRRRRHRPPPLSAPSSSSGTLLVPWWVYLLVAIVDVEANYLVVKAYQYTNIISVQLIDCSTIIFVMILSYLMLKARYKLWHMVGVVLCLLGIVVLVVSDLRSPGNGDNPFLGDMLCVLGALCYAISNVSQEKLVKQYDRVEFLGMLGLFGTLVNGLQLAVLERQELDTMDWSTRNVLLLLGFLLIMFGFYSLIPILLSFSNAALMNLSFLTSDLWAILAGVFIFYDSLFLLMILALVLEVAGIILFNTQDMLLRKEEIARFFGVPVSDGGEMDEIQPSVNSEEEVMLQSTTSYHSIEDPSQTP